MADSKTLYLVDGSGFIFRAYYGIRAPMSSTEGTPTNAVYGFTRLVMNLIRDREPDYVVVAFDPPGPTFRNDIFPEYKANRSEPPDDLKPQFSMCRDATNALGLASIELSGYEADDVIGTLAKRWCDQGDAYRCIIVTADKDMMQLVDDQVTLWDGKEKESAHDEVVAKFGVPPKAVIDLLGLAGDTSDNIPGVPGIGPKTAATLLQKYGDLESLLESAHEIKGKRGENLRSFSDQARLSRKLATIACDVPVEFDFSTAQLTDPDPDVLSVWLRALNFKRFLAEFKLEDHVVNSTQIDRGAYRAILTASELSEVVDAIQSAGRLAIDLETTSLSTVDAEIVGFALAWAPGEAAYVPVAHAYDGAPAQLTLSEVVSALGPILGNPSFPKCAQNVKYEWSVLRRAAQIDLRGVVCDTMLAAYLLDPGRRQFGLDELSADHLGHRMITFSDVTSAQGKDAHFSAVPLEDATAYAAEDADVTLRLWDTLQPRVVEEKLDTLARDVEIPLADVLGRMEITGVSIDAERLQSQSAEFAERIEVLRGEIHTAAGREFNIDSPKQLAGILFEELGLPAEKKTKTGFSTDQQVLNKLATLHPLPQFILDYRHLSKLKNTYLDTLPGLINPTTGRVHSSFRQAVAATGRISSSDPNLQNIPIRTPEGRQIREAFIAAPGYVLLSADYSQIELRVLAHYSKDRGLLDSFADGADIHRRTAAQVFDVPELFVTPEQRRQAKAVNFGLMYGMSAFRLSNELRIPQKEARSIIKRYFEQYAGVKRYFDDAVADARATQRATTLLGRTRQLPHINTQSFNLRQQAERLAVNTPIQGTAADILKVAMLNLDRPLTCGGISE